MPTYQLFITDDRYSVPTLKLVLASNEAGVREQAERSLLESPHHIGVAVYLNAVRLFDVGELARDRDRPLPVDRPAEPGSSVGKAPAG